ncbi:MAG: aminotransferase class I/II-fold pyridoxal phosphate-dependent enzyme [Bacteroidia bacterium]|nr:aminotransferase class I/II-fold pyridoxal phosphate-dependent enzyme [Bacteroidia bacterium]MCZ2130535.1 aminotransferase class I/II-fold pyridoxal phosphate-dependent enzyme [Bacteroidia bacterium]
MNYSSNIKSKFPKVSTSIFTVMSALAKEHDAINLSQGFPDFSPPQELISAVNFYMEKGMNQYAPMAGLMSLREQIAEKMYENYSAQYNPEKEITIVPGGTIGIYAAIASVVRDNDEVIIFEPAYDSYAPAIEANGGKAIFAELKFPTYKPNWEEVTKLTTARTKMIIINSPHNPTGSILSAQDMMKLEKLVKDRDIVILSDEVYEHIIFDGVEHQSVARFPNLAKRSFIVYSFGKTYHATGWKMGYVLAPEELTEEFRKIYQYMAFACNTPMQYAFAEILKDKSLYQNLGAMYGKQRDYFKNGLKGSRFKIKPTLGTYFQLLDYSKISDIDEMQFAEWLVKEKKVAAIPVSSFYRKKENHKVLRFCFAKHNETLDRALEILCKL